MEDAKGRQAGSFDPGMAEGPRRRAETGGACPTRRLVALPAESFDGFAGLLEEPRPPELEALRSRRTRWDR